MGLRSSGSFGSLQQQLFQNSSSPIQTTPPIPRKPPKLFKEEEGLFLWICKFAPRKNVGMLLHCVVSAAAFLWVLHVGKGLLSTLLNAFDSAVPYVSACTFPKFSSLKSAFLPSAMTKFSTHFQVKLPQNKVIGSCPVCYLPVEQAIALMPDAPSFSPGVSNLTYIHEENQSKADFGGSDFGGYPSLFQRNDSDIRESMSFVRGIRPGDQTSFDIDDSNLLEMESCQGVVVASTIFSIDLSVHSLLHFHLVSSGLQF
ncbi:probable hexosyltransferase MUCI70 [Solanum lycopersicum]|uniref:probable hexosyltransferase MUCI70 n=1 Tax=Solanum lycopersicum TaxID=4081 RepID=UPI0008FEBE88|nr:uncharacterized protein LOC104646419 [Solanum lycopersicum]